MIDEANLLSPNIQNNINSQNIKDDITIKRLQHNLIMMGFDIEMINKIIYIFKIKTEEEAIDYLIKSDNGKWNHPFIPKEEDPDELQTNLFEQPKTYVNNVLTRINSIKNFNRKTSNDIIKEDEENKFNDIYNINTNIIKINEPKKNEDICEICGEPKDFHNIKEFNNDNIFEQNDENNILFKEDEQINLLNENNENKINININKENIEEEKKEEENANPNECQICMDVLENPVEIETCKHKFCQECFHSYLVNLITNNQIDSIPCPKNKCKNRALSENFFSQFLSEQEYFKFRQFKAQNEIARDSKKVFCPLCDSYADLGERDELLLDSNNPDYIKTTLKCKKGHEFCSCGRPLHEGDCYHDENEFKDFLVTENIKKCPKCGFYIKKNKGCNHMTCGNPVCKYEFCWLCMKEAVPNHFDYGPCAGKQFFDPDSFAYKLSLEHPCLYRIYSLVTGIIYILLFIICFLALPGLGFAFFSFFLIFVEEDFENMEKKLKIIMFLGYICLGFSLESLVYIAWAIVFAGAGILLALCIVNIVYELLICILKCILCIPSNDEYPNQNHELQDNFNNQI